MIIIFLIFNRIMNKDQATQYHKISQDSGEIPQEQCSQIENVMSCEENSKQLPYLVAFNFMNLNGQGAFKQNMSYEMSVQRGDECWQIVRRQQDFEWVFKAIKNNFPGTIIPYFPSTTILNYLQNKSKQLNVKLNRSQFAPHHKELADFMVGICTNPMWICPELQLFLGKEFEQKNQKIKQLQQNHKQGSTSFSIFSFFSRTLSWFANNQQQKSDSSNELLRIKYNVSRYQSQIIFLIQKFNDLITSKTSQMNCSSGQTEIDSIQILRAKLISSRPFSQKLISQIENKILALLIHQLKKEAQIQEQISDRVQAGQILQHLRKSDQNDHRIAYFTKHIKQFDSTMLQHWPKYEQGWRATVGELDCRFRQIWREYCQKMSKIWR